jgi:hypothetical protein
MNCEFRQFTPDNAGIDAEIDLVKNSDFEGRSLKTQVKAGKSYISSENKNHVKVKVEKKYVEFWQLMDRPVILLFYHPESKLIYWKSVQDYLKCDPKIVKSDTEMVIFPMDKERDLFTPDVINSLRLVAEGRWRYEKIIYVENSQEEVISNWFPVISLPETIYIAPASYQKHKDIDNQLNYPYTFIVKERMIYTFSNLNNPDCELREFCDFSDDVLEIKTASEIDPNFYMELLNRLLVVYAEHNMMIVDNDRFYFSAKVMKDAATEKFDIKPLRREKETSRVKVYINKVGNIIEYKHMAVRLMLFKPNTQWFLQVEPDWYFSYPRDTSKTRKDIGVRITKEKAGTYNEQYLYLLHAWKQYLARNTDTIVLASDHLPDAQTVRVNPVNETFTSNFMLFNDYSEPKK